MVIRNRLVVKFWRYIPGAFVRTSAQSYLNFESKNRSLLVRDQVSPYETFKADENKQRALVWNAPIEWRPLWCFVACENLVVYICAFQEDVNVLKWICSLSKEHCKCWLYRNLATGNHCSSSLIKKTAKKLVMLSLSLFLRKLRKSRKFAFWKNKLFLSTSLQET